MRYTRFLSRHFLVAVSTIGLSTTPLLLSACSPNTSETQATQNTSHSDLKPDPALVTGTLDNGVRYAVLRNQTPPGTGALRVQFQTGSLNEEPGTEGLAHYLEHMAFNGSKNVPEGEMIKILERLGLSFGADTNASTGLDRTVYKLNLPTLEEEVLDAAFMLMNETARNLTLDQDAIERELGIILSEKRTRDSANYRAWETRMRFITQGSDLMDRLPIGTDESLNTISANDFQAYYDAHYHPDKTIVAFVGDKDPKEIVRYIEETFGDWQVESPAGEDHPPRPAEIPKGEVEFYAEEGLPTNISLMTLRTYVKREDTADLRHERLIQRLATGMVGYRMREIAEKADRPFINASMGRMSNFELTEGISFTAYTQPENWKKAVKGLDYELRRVLQNGFSQAELDAQLARVGSSYEAIAEGADTRPTTARTGGLIGSLMRSFDNETVFTHPRENLERFTKRKDSITLEQVNSALRDLWGNLDDVSVFMTTESPIDNAEATIKKALDESRALNVPIADSGQDLAKEFAYANFGKAGNVVSETYREDVDAYLIKFDNNVRLNFKQTDFDKDRVLVQVQFGDGNMSTPRKNEGLRRMAYGVMSESGFEKHTLSETRRLMAGKLVAPSAFNFRDGGDSFFMTTVTVPEYFRDQLNIFAATLTSPGFREDTRLNHINKLKAWYPRHDTTLSGVVSRDVPRIIRSGDERFGFDEEEDFYSASMEEVKSWLKPQLENGLIEITVIGDIDKDSVVEHVSKTLGALPKRADVKGEYTDMRNVSFPEGTDVPFNVYHRGDDNQAQLRIYWPADDGADANYSRRLSVLRAILRNRLVKEIREGEATTYSPQAGSYASQVFPDYGYVTTILTLKPEDIPRMADKVEDITSDMATGSLTEDEFERAIKPMIERLDSQDKRNPYWSSVLSDAQTDGLGLKRHATRESDLLDMTVADVQALASDIFQDSKSIEIHILPTEES